MLLYVMNWCSLAVNIQKTNRKIQLHHSFPPHEAWSHLTQRSSPGGSKERQEDPGPVVPEYDLPCDSE